MLGRVLCRPRLAAAVARALAQRPLPLLATSSAPRVAAWGLAAHGWPAAGGMALSTKAVPHFSVEMPSQYSGRITKWLKAVGDSVKEGEGLCEVETDSVSFTFDSPSAGVMAKILVSASGEAKAQEKLAVLVSSKQDLEAYLGQDLPPSKFSPSARALILNDGVDTAKVIGTGKGGRVMKGDVLVAQGKATHSPPPYIDGARVALPPSKEVYSVSPPQSQQSPSQQKQSQSPQPQAPQTQKQAQAAAPAAPAAPAPATEFVFSPAPSSLPRPIPGKFTDKKPSMVRKVISTRLTESKATVPHFYATIDCRIDSLLALRKTLKSAGVNVSVNDVVVKAVAKALRVVPEVNASWNPSTQTVDTHSGVDVSVAVATDGGLITPIVKAADSKGLIEINDSIRDLAGRARAGKLKPEEYQGGSFTISNLGMYNVDEFTAVINLPQSCILAVGGGISRVVSPEEYGVHGGDDKPQVATIMTVQMSCDRRVIDEALAGQFLSVFRQLVQSPTLLVA